MTLHEAMYLVLKENNRPMTAGELAQKSIRKGCIHVKTKNRFHPIKSLPAPNSIRKYLKKKKSTAESIFYCGNKMKKYLFLFSAILTVSGCFSLSPTFQEREHERIYSAINGKRFYIVEGKGYACTVEGPFEAEVTDRNDIRLRDLETGSLLYSRDEPRIREFFFSQLKMNQTITSESQFRTALVPGGCRCVWHVADGIEHYDAVIEKTVLDKELPIIKKSF